MAQMITDNVHLLEIVSRIILQIILFIVITIYFLC